MFLNCHLSDRFLMIRLGLWVFKQIIKIKYHPLHYIVVQLLSCVQLCDLMDCSTPGFRVHHQLLSLLRLMSIESVMPPNTYVWNLERWYCWTHLQGSSGDADTENRLVGSAGEGEGGRMERAAMKCTHYHTQTDGQWGATARSYRPTQGAQTWRSVTT